MKIETKRKLFFLLLVSCSFAMEEKNESLEHIAPTEFYGKTEEILLQWEKADNEKFSNVTHVTSYPELFEDSEKAGYRVFKLNAQTAENVDQSVYAGMLKTSKNPNLLHDKIDQYAWKGIPIVEASTKDYATPYFKETVKEWKQNNSNADEWEKNMETYYTEKNSMDGVLKGKMACSDMLQNVQKNSYMILFVVYFDGTNFITAVPLKYSDNAKTQLQVEGTNLFVREVWKLKHGEKIKPTEMGRKRTEQLDNQDHRLNDAYNTTFEFGMAFPAGKYQLGDKNLVETAIREAGEELKSWGGFDAIVDGVKGVVPVCKSRDPYFSPVSRTTAGIPSKYSATHVTATLKADVAKERFDIADLQKAAGKIAFASELNDNDKPQILVVMLISGIPAEKKSMEGLWLAKKPVDLRSEFKRVPKINDFNVMVDIDNDNEISINLN